MQSIRKSGLSSMMHYGHKTAPIAFMIYNSHDMIYMNYGSPYNTVEVIPYELYWFFPKKLREKRETKKITQIELAEKLNMCSRTIIEIENCRSNPRFETVALLAREMNISLDGVVFYDDILRETPKCVTDFFAGKSEAEAQKYIDLCLRADELKK